MKYYNYLPLLAALIAVGCKAQSGMKPKAVYMYTNGYTYVQAEGKVKCTDGKWSLTETDIPPALQGTVWFHSPQGINFVSRSSDTVEKSNFTPDVEALLRNNIGKKVTLHFSNVGATRLEGEILKVFGKPDAIDKSYSPLNDAVALLKTDAGNVIVYRNLLNQLSFVGLADNADYDVKSKSVEQRMTVHFKKKESEAQLEMVYAQNHSAWAPGYRLLLTGKNDAVLSLSAEISSGNWELTGSELNLVVGTPSFYGFLSRLYGDATNVSPQTSYDEAASDDSYRGKVSSSLAESEDTNPTYASASATADFYVYSINNFSLPKNSHALVNIFEEKVNIQHTYDCQIPGISSFSTISSFTAENAPKIPVYHHIKFINPVKQPLVAAGCMIASNQNKVNATLGQAQLQPSAPGAKVDLNVAQSLDLPVVHFENEVSRQAQAKTIPVGAQTYYFDKVSVKAEIQLENASSEEKTVVVSRYVEGELLNSTADWVLVKHKQQNYNPNNIHSVTWTMKLKAGEKKIVVYNYEYFQRIYY